MAASKPSPPVPEKRPVGIKFGVVEGENRGKNPMDPPKELVDNYFWFRDDKRESTEVIGHLEKENEYCDASISHIAEFKDALYAELKAHVKETDDKVPYPHGEWLYFTRTIEGKAYSLHCRMKPGAAPEAAEVILDENELAEGLAHCDINSVRVSPSHNLLAYTMDTKGDETYEVLVKDLTTGELRADKIGGASGDIAWGADDRFIYYLKLDAAHRPYQIWRHALGSDVSTDEQIYEELDELFWVGITRTRSGRYLLLESGSSETSEISIIDLNEADGRGKAQIMAPRVFGTLYEVDHRHGHWYIMTNEQGAKNFTLKTCPAEARDRATWQQLAGFPYDAERMITSVDCFNNFVVVSGRQGGYSQVWVLAMSGEGIEVASSHRIELPEAAHRVGLSYNKVWDTNNLRLSYASLVTPNSTLEYDLAARTSTCLKEDEVPGYDRRHYDTAHTEATAADGIKVPISIVFRKDLVTKGTPAPLMLYGYGSYGMCMEPSFDLTRLALLDRGVVFAIAHIRGGGEMGRPWYEDMGKYLTKRNTFTDFCTCGEHLQKEGWTSPDKMACWGRSAGGLLIGATLNLRPDLFCVALAGVPFVDIMATMADPSIPLTIGEWEEWGNPNEEKYHEYMLSYSPMNNIKPQGYPAVLVTAGLHDPRVPYWEPMKWVTLLRENTTSDKPILLKTDLTSGHFSASDRYKWLKERAFDFSFLLDRLGLAGPPAPYPPV